MASNLHVVDGRQTLEADGQGHVEKVRGLVEADQVAGDHGEGHLLEPDQATFTTGEKAVGQRAHQAPVGVGAG